MRHLTYLIVLAATWSLSVHAQDFAQRAAAKEAQSALPWLSLDALSATRERPLFAPGRRKPSPPPPVTVVPDPAGVAAQLRVQQQPQFQLTGIIASPAETIVLLRDPTTSRSIAFHPGDNIGPWRISVDSNYTVELKAGAKAFRLEMFTEPGERLRAVP